MNAPGSVHLTEEEFADAMLGEPVSAAAALHLQECATCRREVDGFSTAVGDFRQASRAWSELRSDGMPALRPEAARTTSGAGGFAPAYAWAAAGLLAVGVTVPVVEHLRHEGAGAPAPVRVAQADQDAAMDTPEQIARDNQLLAEVHFELTRTDLPVHRAGRKGRP